MSEWLILRLDHGSTGTVAWMTANEGGQAVMPPQSGLLPQIAQLAGTRRLCVLVPASEVTTLDADLPARAGAKLLQAVPFAVEDQFAENVEDLHFALGERSEGQRTNIAAVSRNTLNGWLERLAASGLRPERLYADAALLPQNPQQIVALIERDTLLIRAPGLQPMALPAGSLAESLDLALSNISADATQPGLLLYASAQDWQHYSSTVEPLRPRFAGVKVQLLGQGALPLLAQQLPATTAINLLQGEHAPSRSVAAGFRPWSLAAALALVLIGMYASGRYWELSRLHKTEIQLDSAVGELASSVVPNLAPGRDVRKQVEQRLKAVRGIGAGGSADLLNAVSAFASARSAAPDALLQGMAFQTGALELRLKAPGADSIERIRQRLQAAGWQAVLKGGSGRGSSFEGRLEIRPDGG